MKRFWRVVLTAASAAAVLAVWACLFQGGDPAADVVVINGSHTPVGPVGLTSRSCSRGSRRADNDPMERGDRVSFDQVDYPAAVTVYGDLDGLRPLAAGARAQAGVLGPGLGPVLRGQRYV